MRYRYIAYAVAVAGLCLIGLHLFLSKHIIAFHGPAVGGEFRKSEQCQARAEALFLALQAAKHLNKDWSFGLAEASNSITKNSCIGTSGRSVAPTLITMIQDQATGFHTHEPNWVLSRETGRDAYVGAVPRWPIGLLSSVFSKMDNLSSQKGLTWFLRCDYSLGLEPFRSFMVSDLHIGQLDNATANRIEECGMAAAFNRTLTDHLSAIPDHE